MKRILLLLLLSTSVCHAQIDSARYKAGAELVKFNKIHKTGSMLEVGGLVLTLASTTTITTNLKATAIIAASGTLLSFIGYIVEGTSYKHIRWAGLYLQGDSIILPLDHKKKRRA